MYAIFAENTCNLWQRYMQSFGASNVNEKKIPQEKCETSLNIPREKCVFHILAPQKQPPGKLAIWTRKT